VSVCSYFAVIPWVHSLPPLSRALANAKRCVFSYSNTAFAYFLLLGTVGKKALTLEVVLVREISAQSPSCNR
jgi:hypothetical protein